MGPVACGRDMWNLALAVATGKGVDDVYIALTEQEQEQIY